MKAKTVALLVLLVLFGSALAQKDKKWTDWNKKEAQKMLEDSPWAKKQTDTDASQQMFTPTSAPGIQGAGTTSNDASRAAQGATNQAVNVSYFVRFFSARPIRQALARSVELNQAGLSPEVVGKLHSWAEVKSQDSIIITVTFSGNDQRYTNPVMQAFNSATTAAVKNNTYLQRSDGKQLFLEDYVPPGKDGFGARFIFERLPQEKLFIGPDTKEIRFFSQFGVVKVDRRFKIADMMYEGELEY
jgi:hypothetical protein